MVGYVLGPFFLITLVGVVVAVVRNPPHTYPHLCEGRAGWAWSSLHTASQLSCCYGRGGCGGKPLSLVGHPGLSGLHSAVSLLQVMYVQKKKR